jgi:hypothetical protein
MKLNEYKSIVLKPQDRNGDFNKLIESVISDKLQKQGFPKPLNKSVLYTDQGSSCDLLTCNYTVKNISAREVVIQIELDFLNCNYETVYLVKDDYEALFFGKKAISKSLEKALEVFDDFTYKYNPLKANNEEQQKTQNQVSQKPYTFEKKSDIDREIPKIEQKSNRFALIIGNEEYTKHQQDLASESDVAFARNDANAFKLYAQRLLGVPESNIIFHLDATGATMNQALAKLQLIIKNTNGDAEVFVYYAGHGLPDEKTKTPYLIPVDVSGKNPTFGINLMEMYTKLSEYPSKRIIVFLDACFTGGARNQGLIAARGVKIKPKNAEMKGSLITFSASSGNQSSLPYKNENHGFFTYYLLKKLKETKAEISYGELADYLKKTISLQSVLINNKEQTPQVNTSMDVKDEWMEWRVNE